MVLPIKRYKLKDILDLFKVDIKTNPFYLQEIVVDGYYWVYAIMVITKNNITFDIIFNKDAINPSASYTPEELEKTLKRLSQQAKNVKKLIYG